MKNRIQTINLERLSSLTQLFEKELKATAQWVLLFCCFCLSTPAFSEVTRIGDTIHDSETDLIWLDATITRNISYNDVLAQLEPGGAFEGWRYATQAEFNQLMNSLGVPYSSGLCSPNYCDYYGTDEPPAVAAAIGYLGDTLLEFWESDPNDAFNFIGVGATYGMLANPIGVNARLARVFDSERYFAHNGAFKGDAEDAVFSDWRGPGFNNLPVYIFRGDRIVGSLLVRDFTPPEPEADFDLDGIPDVAELGGIDVDGDGVIEFDLAGLGADPCRKTIVVEIDYMNGAITGFNHVPHPDLISTVAAAFDAAPIPAAADCPFAGFPSQPSGVNFIAMIDEAVPEQAGNFNRDEDLDLVRSTYFDERLLPWLHYALFVHRYNDKGSSGTCCNQGSFLVSLGSWELDNMANPGTLVSFYDPDGDQREKLLKEAGTFMHELGHALQLGHGGDDNINYKPNYLSIMNYWFQFSWLTNADDPANPVLDYSRELLPELDETELYEMDLLCDHAECQHWMTAWNDPIGDHNASKITDVINWNTKDGIESLPVEVDINDSNEGHCVGDGQDNVMDTTPAGDDVINSPYINPGPNATCETTVAAGSDDSQLGEPDSKPDVAYDGHDDWPAIKFLAEENAYGEGVSSYEESDIEEMTADEAEEIYAFWEIVREVLLEDNPNKPPTAEPQSVNLDEDTSGTILLSGNDEDDFPVTPLAFVIESGPTNGALSGTAPNLTFTPKQHFFGSDSFTFRTFDGELSSTLATVEITIAPVNDPPVINISRSTASLEYSDTIGLVTITATDIDDHPLTLTSNWTLDGAALNAGLPSALAAPGSCSVENTDFSPASGTNCSWTFSGQMLESSGNYDIQFTVTDDGGSSTSVQNASKITELIIAEESAAVEFAADNSVAVQVAIDGGNSGSFALIVAISENIPDVSAFAALPGDVGNAMVSMTLSPVGPGASAVGSCSLESVDPVSDGYAQTQTVKCTFSDVAVNTYTAIVAVNGGFYTGSAEDVLTIYDPSLGFTSGGGWFYWPGTVDRTNFGYTMKYGKKGNKVKGNLLLIRHLADKSGKYRIKSNALQGLAIGEDSAIPMGWASFSGKNTYIEPGWEVSEGNHEFTVYVEDHNQSETNDDRFWIQIKDKNDTVIDVMSMSNPGSENTVSINGGNVVVPH